MDNEQQPVSRKKITPIEYVGLAMVGLMVVVMLFFQEDFAGIYDVMFAKSFEMFGIYIFQRNLGAAIVISVMTGRIIERLGFTDALIRLFMPIMTFFKINSSVIVGVIYNIIGDVNASARIAAPVVRKAGGTKDEQKIAVATLVQAPTSFSIVVFGIMALNWAKISVFPVVVFTFFVPIVITPLFFKLIWRDTKAVKLLDLPRFTPNSGIMQTIFGSAREGAEMVFLFIMPSGCVIFAFIGILDYIGVWGPLNGMMGTFLNTLGIEPQTGVTAIAASTTLAMSDLSSMLSKGVEIAQHLVLGSFMLANCSILLSVLIGQIPVLWAAESDLTEAEVLRAAFCGIGFRLVYIALCSFLLTPLVI